MNLLDVIYIIFKGLGSFFCYIFLYLGGCGAMYEIYVETTAFCPNATFPSLSPIFR